MQFFIDNGGKYGKSGKSIDKLKKMCYNNIRIEKKEGETMNKPFAETGKQKKEKIAIALDKRDFDLISTIAEYECRSRSNVIQLAVKEFLRNHGYYNQTAETVKPDDAPPQPTESHTTGEKATHETDTQHPDDTTDEPLSVSEWSGISGRTAPLPDSWKK